MMDQSRIRENKELRMTPRFLSRTMGGAITYVGKNVKGLDGEKEGNTVWRQCAC